MSEQVKAALADVEEAMKDVVDPELGINVVDLGLVYGIHVDEDNVATLDMTLTSAACPLTDVISVKGAVLDQMGRHADAQRHYASALRLVPNEPSVLSNLGLSYALSKKLPQAETTLRRAAEQPGAEPKVRQNLALVVGLQGRFQEAEAIARGGLSPEEAAANVAVLRRMLAQQADWKKSGHRGSPLAPSTGS